MKVTIDRCARCSAPHEELEFKPLTNPPSTFGWWSICPTALEPVLMHLQLEPAPISGRQLPPPHLIRDWVDR